MTTLAIVGFAAASLTVVSVATGLFALAREACRRGFERRALARCDAARALIRAREQAEGGPAATASLLAARFDPVTIQRALEAALLEQHRDLSLFERLGLTARYLREVRGAATFCARAHAADVLGRLGVPEACGPLLAALRDPDEDLTVKQAAADALARIRDPRAVPHLVRDLSASGARASPHLADALVGFGAAAVPALSLALSDERAEARAGAARILGEIGDASATGLLLGRLRDAHAGVREAAAEALGRLGDPRATAPLGDAAVGDPAPRVRASAAQALGRLGREDAAEALVAMLSDDDAVARAHALDALAALRPKDVEPVLRALLDPAPPVRRRAAVALARMGVLDAWMADLAADDPVRRERARADVALLARAGLEDSLFSYLTHPEARIRAAVVDLWGALGPTRFAPAVLAAAGDPDAGVRASVAGAIGRARPPGGAEALAALLADPDVGGRAAIALGRIGGEVAARALLGDAPVDPATLVVARVLLATDEALTRATDDLVADAALRRRVVEVIEEEGEELWATFLDRLRCWGRGDPDTSGHAGETAQYAALLRTSPDEDARLDAAVALADAGAESDLDALADALAGDPSAGVRLASARALAARPASPAARAALSRAALDPCPEVAVVAAGALGRLRDPAYAEPLFARLASGSAALRSAVEEALAQIYGAHPAALLARLPAADAPDVVVAYVRVIERMADPRTEGALRALQGSPDARVREAVVHALAALPHPAAASGLRAALGDPSAVVRSALARALARVPGGEGAALLRTLRGADPSPAVRAVAAETLVTASSHRVRTRMPGSGRRVGTRPRRLSRDSVRIVTRP